MSKVKKDTIEVKGIAIQIYTEDFKNDYISLTGIARYKNREEPNVVVANWMRSNIRFQINPNSIYNLYMLAMKNFIEKKET